MGHTPCLPRVLTLSACVTAKRISENPKPETRNLVSRRRSFLNCPAPAAPALSTAAAPAAAVTCCCVGETQGRWGQRAKGGVWVVAENHQVPWLQLPFTRY